MIEFGELPTENMCNPSEECMPATLVELELGDSHIVEGAAGDTVVRVNLPGEVEHSIESSDHDWELSIESSRSNSSIQQTGSVSINEVPSNSIVAISSFKIPTIDDIHSFKLTLADASEISTFDPAYWPVELVGQGQTATLVDRWQLPASTAISNFYYFSTEHRDLWLFVTNLGQFGHLFGRKRPSDVRLQRFLIAGGNVQVSIDEKKGSSCVGPITAVSSDASIAPTIKRVDVYISDHGVTGIHFVEPGAGAFVSTSLPCSFDLQDYGSPDAECITELCALQDDNQLYALQVLTNRGRASTVRLPYTWIKAFTAVPSPSAEQVCNELRRKLEDTLDKQFTGARIMHWLRFSRTEWCCLYPAGILCFALMAFICTAIAGVNSGFIPDAFLGVMFPLAFCSVFLSSGAIRSRKYYFGNSYIRSRNACYFSCVWFIALSVGAIAASKWLIPWWFATRGGTVYNVDATATSWIASNSAPHYGTYHFSQLSSSGDAAFINQAQAGAVRPAPPYVWFCVAPIVTSWNQTKVVFWATDTGCCSKSGVTCWLRFNSPGSAAISASVKPMRDIEFFEMARFASCSNLAINTSNSAQSLCSLPAVYLNVASTSTPEDTTDYNLLCGLLLICLIAIVWPYPVYHIMKIWSESEPPQVRWQDERRTAFMYQY